MTQSNFEEENESNEIPELLDELIETNIQLVKYGQASKVKKTMSAKEVEREKRIYNVISNCGKGYTDAIDYLSAVADATKI